jgi:hypothetical protein
MVVRVDGRYRVQAGAYQRRENAERVAAELRKREMRPSIVEPRAPAEGGPPGGSPGSGDETR